VPDGIHQDLRIFVFSLCSLGLALGSMTPPLARRSHPHPCAQEDLLPLFPIASAAQGSIRYAMSFLLLFQLSPHLSLPVLLPPLPPSLSSFPQSHPSSHTDVILAGMAGSTHTVSPPWVPASVRGAPHPGGREGRTHMCRNILSMVCTSVLQSRL
jgi:hypothetical protein